MKRPLKTIIILIVIMAFEAKATQWGALDELKESMSRIFTTRSLPELNQEIAALETRLREMLVAPVTVRDCSLLARPVDSQHTAHAHEGSRGLPVFGLEIVQDKSERLENGSFLLTMEIRNRYSQRKYSIHATDIEKKVLKELFNRLQGLCAEKVQLLFGMTDKFINNHPKQGMCHLSEHFDSEGLSFNDNKVIQKIYKEKKYYRLGEILDTVSFNTVVNGLFSRLTASHLNEALDILDDLPELAYRMGHDIFSKFTGDVIHFAENFPAYHGLGERAKNLKELYGDALHQIDFKKKMGTFLKKFGSGSSEEEKSKNEKEYRRLLGDHLKEMIKVPQLVDSLALPALVDFLMAVKKNTFHWDELDDLYTELLQKNAPSIKEYLQARNDEENERIIQKLKEKGGKIDFQDFREGIVAQNDFVWILSELGGRSAEDQRSYGELINEAGFKMALLLRYVQRSIPETWHKQWEGLAEGFDSYQRWDKAGQILGSIIRREMKMETGQEAKNLAIREALDLINEQVSLEKENLDFSTLMERLKKMKSDSSDNSAHSAYHYLIMKLDQ